MKVSLSECVLLEVQGHFAKVLVLPCTSVQDFGPRWLGGAVARGALR